MNSPPKRITRARAAAKASEATVKTTKVVPAAITTRATSTATSSTKSATAKRKTRADEIDGEDELGDTNVRRTTRARSRFIASSQDIRGTQQKVLSNKPTRSTAATALSNEIASEPARPRRRPRSTPACQANGVVQQTKERPTRGRATIHHKMVLGSKTAATKKRVKFQEPGKENLHLEDKPKDLNGANSLRGRPARRGNKVLSEFSSKDFGKSSVCDSKQPLSPRKVTQMPCGREIESSEDELDGCCDGSKSGAMLLLRSPKKSPNKVQMAAVAAKDFDHVTETEAENITIDATKLRPTPDSASLGSPPRRPPASPPKDSLKSPAKKMGAVLLPGSVLKPTNSLLVDHKDQTQLAKTPSFLQSPAKRPPSPIKNPCLTSPTGKDTLRSTTSMKSIMFRSPAKRAMPGLTMPIDQAREDGQLFAQPLQSMVVLSSGHDSVRQTSNHLLLAKSKDECHDHATLSPSSRLLKERRVSQQPTAGLLHHSNSILNNEHRTNELNSDRIQASGTYVALSIKEDMKLDSHGSVSRSPLHQSTAATERHEAFGQSEQEEIIMLRENLDQIEDTRQLHSINLAPDTESTLNVPIGSSVVQFQCQDGSICCETGSDFATDDNTSALEHPTSSCVRKSQASSNLSGYAKKLRNETRSSVAVASLPELNDACSPIDHVRMTAYHSAMPGSPTCGDLATTTLLPDAVLGSDLSSMQGIFLKKQNYIFDDVSEVEAPTPSVVDQIDEEVLTIENVIMADEDVALAEEANHLSILSQHQLDEVDDVPLGDESPSESSQEYGDENQVPVDPACMRQKSKSPVTPDRPPPLQYFCTTTTVPLKPADDSEPSSSRQRSLSAPRTCSAATRRSPRSDTILSTPCSKSVERVLNPSGDDLVSTPMGKSGGRNFETLGRTPQRETKSELLRGAVVFVDVYTSDGADASGIFVELLTHMGAKCVKTWHWNPQNLSAGGTFSGKIGITHVVYKDGGKRTMEKLQETNGIVHCVGVGWVLDCERENEWLDESPYSVDITHTPRRGARRRKSMEPDAIENLNGAIISSTGKSTRTPKTPRNRRESTLWVVSPVDKGDQVEDNDLEWACAPLTPVPKTPAPETVTQYVADLPETPYTSDGSEATSSARQHIITKTCPSKTSKYRELGDAVLAVEKSEQVMLRLMAARRKSLQFAPKVGSPLAKTW